MFLAEPFNQRLKDSYFCGVNAFIIHMNVLLFISGQEIIIVLLVVVMFFGAKRIPEIARGLGQGVKYVRNATNEIKREINDSAESNDDVREARDAISEGKKALDDLTDSVRRSTRL